MKRLFELTLWVADFNNKYDTNLIGMEKTVDLLITSRIRSPDLVKIFLRKVKSAWETEWFEFIQGTLYQAMTRNDSIYDWVQKSVNVACVQTSCSAYILQFIKGNRRRLQAQPRPQGAFPKPREKRPGDEVAAGSIPYSSYSFSKRSSPQIR